MKVSRSSAPPRQDTMLDKWAHAQPTAAVVREFLEWLDCHQIDLAKPLPTGNRYMPIIEDREHLIARFVGVDLQKLECERRALLADKLKP